MNTAEQQFNKMTQTPIPRLIIELAIPTTITMFITNIYNVVDTAFVGRLGNSASGAVGVVLGLMAIIQAFGFIIPICGLATCWLTKIYKRNKI